MQVSALKAFSSSGVSCLLNQLIKTGSASDSTLEQLCPAACCHTLCWSSDQCPPTSALLPAIWPGLAQVVIVVGPSQSLHKTRAFPVARPRLSSSGGLG